LDDGLPLPDQSLTVAQLLERWYDDVLRHQVAESAASGYRSVATHHIIPSLGRKKLAALTTSDIDRLLSSKMDGQLAVSSVRRIRSVLAQAIDQGIRWGAVNRNVATLARAPRSERKEGRTLTPDQAKLFLEELSGHRNEALYALMLSVGLRRGEALGLRWSDLDAKSGILLVQRQLKRETSGIVVTDTKTAKSRRAINLPTPMVRMLKRHRARQAAERLALGDGWTDSGYIFTSSIGTPIDPRNLLREFKSICVNAGLGDWHLHELRHSAASLMLAMGVPLQVVSEVLGHASIRMTADVYGHIMAPDRKAAAEAMSHVLWPDSNP
jgi:integrase